MLQVQVGMAVDCSRRVDLYLVVRMGTVTAISYMAVEMLRKFR